MLIFVPDATFTQQLIMYSFFIVAPILLLLLVAFVGIKSAKQNMNSRRCPHCSDFVREDWKTCKKCGKDLDKNFNEK